MFLEIVLLSLFLYLLYFVICRFYVPKDRNHDVSTYPGKIRFFGNILAFSNINDMNNKLEQIGRFTLDNNDLSKFYLGPIPCYVVTNPEDASIVLNKCVDKMIVYSLIVPLLGKMLVAAEVPVWKSNRRILNLAFKQTLLLEYLELFNTEASRLVDSLAVQAGRGYIDLTGKISRSVLETSCRFTLGTRADGSDLVSDRVVTALDRILEIITSRLGKPWLLLDSIFCLTGYKKEFAREKRVFSGLAEQMIKIRKIERAKIAKNKENINDASESKVRSCVDIFLENSSTEPGSHLSDDDLQNLMDNVLIAAFDTTTPAMILTLVCIGTYQDVQQKIVQEINEVLGEKGTVNKMTLSRLVYLEAVIKECFRLYPVAPIVGRQATTDVQLGNQTIPAGTPIAVHIWGVNRNQRYWGADTEEFRPQRWLEPDSMPSHPAAFASFSPGRRGCVGRNYALMYFKATLVALLRRYKVTADVSKLSLLCNIMVKPKSGHLIKLDKR